MTEEYLSEARLDEIEQLARERDHFNALRLITEIRRLRAELDTIRYAAHMPEDYAYGLPSWINQKLYNAYLFKGSSQAKDIEQIITLKRQNRRVRQSRKRLVEWVRNRYDRWTYDIRTGVSLSRILADVRMILAGNDQERYDHGGDVREMAKRLQAENERLRPIVEAVQALERARDAWEEHIHECGVCQEGQGVCDANLELYKGKIIAQGKIRDALKEAK